MNALREKFIIPVSATAALAAAVCAPKSTGLYKLCGALVDQPRSNVI
jgi:hypothetical protein